MKHAHTRLLAGALSCVSALAAAASPERAVPGDSIGRYAVSSEGHTGTLGPDPVALQQQQLDLQAMLRKLAPAGVQAAGFSVSLTPEDRISIGHDEHDSHAENVLVRRYRVGVAKALGARIDFGNALRGAGAMNVEHQGGALSVQGNDATWAAPVSSPQARGLRLHFTDLDLADGVELFAYNESGQAHGPWTGNGPWSDGEFWSPTFAGSELTLQLHGPIDAVAASRFTLAEVGHLGPRFALADRLVPFPLVGPDNPSTPSASCVVDASCGGASSAVNDARDAAAYILFFEGAFGYICSGGLIADTDSGSEVPLFLTANHCVGKGRTARTVEASFGFVTNSCNNWGNTSFSGTVNGATLLASGRSGDYSLLRLSGNPPNGSAFMGFEADFPTATADGTHLYRISHPEGAAQAYSEHDVDANSFTCGTLPRGEFIYSQDIVGATLGGSSGSPVVNGSGKVVGQLYGACGYALSEDCNTVDNRTVDGALAHYYPNVAQWLDPVPGGGGGDGGGDSGGKEKGRNKCSDGIDNDGDGLIDGADPDC